MNLFNRFVPNFLQRLDKHLLLHHRLIWETKFHYVLFYGLIGLFSALAIGAFYPISTSRSIPSTGFFIIISAIPAFILLAFWTYKQYLHTIERDFGNLNVMMGQKRLLIYGISAMFFLAPSIIMPYMIHNRIKALASSEQLEQDRKTLNEGNPFFPISTKYRYETDNMHSYFDCAYNNNYQDDYCDKGQIFTRFGRIETPMSYMTAEQLHDTYVKNLDQKDALVKIEKFITVSEKYGGAITMSPQEVLTHFVNEKQIPLLNMNRVKSTIARQLWDIEAHHYPFISSRDSYTFWGSLFAGISFFAILLHLVKAVTLRDLIISAVTLVAVGIGVTVLTITVDEFRSLLDVKDEQFASLFVLGLYGIALYQAAGISVAKTYSRSKTVMLTIVNLTTPMLVFWLAFTGDTWHVFDIKPTDEFLTNLVLIGIAIYGLVFFPWFRKLHLKMYSLPKA